MNKRKTYDLFNNKIINSVDVHCYVYAICIYVTIVAICISNNQKLDKEDILWQLARLES